MRAFSGNTRRRPDRTHGGVLNAHTDAFSAFSVFLALSLLSVCASFSSPFPLFSSLLSFSLVFSLFSLSNDDNDHSSSRALSLSIHTALPCPLGKSACTLAHCFANMFASCKKQLSWIYYASASLAPLWNEVGLFLCGRWRSV